MKRPFAPHYLVLCVPIVILLSCGSILATVAHHNSSSSFVAQHYNTLPLAFEPNRGQTTDGVRFVSRAMGFSILLKDREADFVLPVHGQSALVQMRFPGSRFAEKPAGFDLQEGVSNYLVGNSSSNWRTNIPNFGRVGYVGVYPGVDLFFYGNHSNLEHDFVLSPGADYHRIQIELAGVQGLSLREDGGLSVSTSSGNLIFRKPEVYQYKNGLKVTIRGEYAVISATEFGFRLGRYDHNLPLVIDPILSYSTYLAGSNSDLAAAIAVDQAGSAYVTGNTVSTDFPVQNPEQGQCAGSCAYSDVFVTKFNPAGSALVYSTYVGGSNADTGTSISVDSQGNAVVVGTTNSYDFPQHNGLTAVLSTDTHGFAFSLNPNGSAFNFSTFLGGIGTDYATGVATDSSGDVYVSGYTSSVNFPLTPGNQIGPPPANFSNDIFLTKLGSSGALLLSTMVGGTSSYYQGTFGDANFPVSVAVGSQGEALLAGNAYDGFPTTPGSFQPSHVGNSQPNAFLAWLNPAGSAILYGTYLGGTGGDYGNQVVVDSQNNSYIVGTTGSQDFPTTPGVLQTSNLSSNQVAFVARLNAALSALSFSTYLGGTQSGDYNVAPAALRVDSQGNTFVTGYTRASSYPLVNPLQGSLPQNIYGNSYAVFLSVLNSSANALTFSTFLSGSVAAAGSGVALDSSDNAYVTGYTFDPDFPTTPGSFQPSIPAPAYPIQHAFVTKFDIAAPNAGTCVSSNILYFGDVEPGHSSRAVPLTLTNCGTLQLDISSTSVTNPDFVIVENTCHKVLAGASCTVKLRYTPPVADGLDTGSLVFDDNAPINPQKISLQGYSTLPYLAFEYNAIGFGDEVVGQTSAPFLGQVYNQGSLPIHFSSVTATAGFNPVSKCPKVLLPGAYCELGASFTPTAAGENYGTLSVYDDAYGSPQTVSLSGNGLTSYPTPVINYMYPNSAKLGSHSVKVLIQGTDIFPASIVTLNGKTVPSVGGPYPGEVQFTVPSSMLTKLGSLSVQVVNPAPGGPSAPASFSVYNQVAVGASDILYEPFTQKFYAAIPSNGATNPNSLVTIDPVTGALGTPIPIGNNPGVLGLSTDGTTLWVGINGDYSVLPFNVTAQTAGSEVALGSDPAKGAFTAANLQVQPGAPSTVVTTVSAGYNGNDGIELIENGKVVADFLDEPPNNIAVGGTRFVGTSDLFGWSSIWNAWGLDQFVIVGSNLYEATGIPGEYGMGPFDTNGTYLFDVDGQVFNAVSGALVGTISQVNQYTPENGVLSDVSSGRTFFVDQYGDVLVVDSQSLQLIGYTSIPATSPPNRLMHWGPDGFAFPTLNTSTGLYDLVISRTGYFLPSTGQNPVPTATAVNPPTVRAGSSNFVLTVTGTQFVQGAVVTWNGQRRTTTWLSSTQVTADIPASDIVTLGKAKVAVVNPPPGGGTSLGLTVTIRQ